MVLHHTMLRAGFRRELLPRPLLWLLATDATTSWLRAVEKTLGAELGDRERARRVLAAATAPAWQRRYDVLAGTHAFLPSREHEPKAVARMMRALYPLPPFRRVAWLLDDVGGVERSARGALTGFRWAARLSHEERWCEAATHLGELLIVLTEELPRHGVTRAPALLGQLCFDAGARYAQTMKQTFALPDVPDSAIEVLRMGEYIYRVNPEHEAGSDVAAGTGYIVGNACPWYVRPGWGGMHCGIFGQFQSGICATFGLSYRLTRTIPRHGGEVCRVDLRPLRVRRSALGDAVSSG